MTGREAIAGTLLVVLVTVLLPRIATSAPKWEKATSDKGITVWSREVEGSPNVATKAVARIDATTDELWDYLQQEKNHKKMSPNVVDYRDLGSCGTNCKYIYQRISHPLIKDRHFVVEVRWSSSVKDGLTTYKRWTKATKAKSPPVTGPILVETISGRWTLAPIDDGARTRMTRISHLEIGGNVPPSVYNGGAVKSAFKYFVRLKKAF